MAEKRINDQSRRTATSADLTAYNYVLIDGAGGSAKCPLSLLLSVRDGGVLTDAASIPVENNAISQLTTSQSSLTLNVNCEPGEIPNFAVEITTTEAVTLSVVKIVGSGSSAVATTLKYSAAGGNELESGKTYQLTCVGSCWTVAEFVDPTAQRSVPPQEQDQEESETRSVIEDEPESPGGADDNGSGDDGEGDAR